MNTLSTEELKEMRAYATARYLERFVRLIDEAIAIRELKGDQVPVAIGADIIRDANRYRFLRDEDAWGEDSDSWDFETRTGLISWGNLCEVRTGDFDAAVDARMAASDIPFLNPATAPQKPVVDYFSSLVAMGTIAAEKAMRKFPQPNYVLLKVAEEAGEVVQAGVHYAEGRMTWSELEGEVIQLIAMLNRLMVEGDQVNGIKPPPAIEAAGGIVKDGE